MSGLGTSTETGVVSWGNSSIEIPRFDTDFRVLTVRRVVQVLGAPSAHAVVMRSADDVTFRG